MSPSPAPLRIHFIGICGTGMGALAGALRALGHDVRGSDAAVYPPMSTALAAWGIPVSEGFSAANLEPRPDVVVVGNVVSRGHPEAVAARERDIPQLSMPEAIQRFILAGRRPLVVVGTHGKTTTTALVARLLHVAGLEPGFLVGGLPVDFPASFRLGAPPYFVIEGDEYDSAYFDKRPKFMHYAPDAALLTGIEFDHADIYPDLAAVRAAFERFVDLLPTAGLLVACADDALAGAVALGGRARVTTYGLAETADWRATERTTEVSGQSFTLRHRGRVEGRFQLPLYGTHNVVNAVGALALARELGLERETLARGLAAFHGVRRRQEIVFDAPGVTLVDDFGQHPSAVRETIRSVRQRFPERRLTVVYRPESNTVRRRSLQADFVPALAGADRLVFVGALRKASDPATMETLDVAALLAAVQAAGAAVCRVATPDEAVQAVLDDLCPPAVVLVLSARALDGGVAQLAQALAAR